MADTDGSGFGRFVPGFDFMQNLARQAAGGIVQGVQQSVPQLPNLNNWVAPTFSVEELEKRIAELKAVQFWLDQNARALAATVQALEVQKMTLATLQGMNFNLGDVANALKIRAADTVASMAGMAGLGAAADVPAPAPASTAKAKDETRFKGLEVPPRKEAAASPAPAPAAPEPEPAPAAASPAATVDPMLWWGALSQQFQNIATQAMKDVATQAALDASKNVAATLTREAVKTATQAATAVAQSAVQAVAKKTPAKPASAAAPGRKAAVKKSPQAAAKPAKAPTPGQTATKAGRARSGAGRVR